MPPQDMAAAGSLSRLEFRQWAEFGTEAYGKTPWFFLRELAQNGRDAGAREIHVSALRDAQDREIIVFEDDGSGMSFDHARSFLFRLYSSSKADDPRAAGMYGIGFWTVLHFNPDEIRIESNTGGERWAVSILRDLEARSHPCSLARRGTRVTLVRQAAFSDREAFRAQVQSELRHHCRFLRRLGRRPRPLDIFLGDERINEPLELPGLLSLSFRSGAIEGVVGVDEKPRVELFAKGLSIWRGAFLEDLLSPGTPIPETEVGAGVYPVFLVNGNNLKVNLFRREALADNELRRLIDVSRSSLRRLISGYSRQVYSHRGWGVFREYWQRSRRLLSPWVLGGAALLIAGAGIGLWLQRTARPSPPSSLLRPAPGTFLGIIEPGRQPTEALQLTYMPAEDTLLKVYAADGFDAEDGFFRSNREDTAVSLVELACQGGGRQIHLGVEGNIAIHLPRPTGFGVDPASLTIERKGRVLPALPPAGEERLMLPRGDWLLISYRCCPEYARPLSGAAEKWLTLLPEKSVALLHQLLAAQGTAAESLQDKIDLAAAATSKRLFYDRSPAATIRFQGGGAGRGWLDRVLAAGGGDCDVLNGFMVLLLRRQGIPSRMAVGLVGRGGKVMGGLHAWCEYFDGSWREFDVTPYCSPAQPGAAEGPVIPPPEAGRGLPVRTIFLAVGALITLLLGLRIAFSRGSATLAAVPKDDVRRGLGKIAAQMVRKPQAWGWDRRLWSQGFLPLRGSGMISLHEALRLARKGRLFIAAEANPLAEWMPRRCGRVLAGDDESFARLFRSFPGAIDLDWVFGLRADFPEHVAREPLAELLSTINRLLPRVSSRLPRLMWAPGLGDRDWEHVCLHPTSRRRAGDLPLAFIAVNPASAELARLASLSRRNPRLAIFRAFRLLLSPTADPAHATENECRLARILLQGRV